VQRLVNDPEDARERREVLADLDAIAPEWPE
jgi:hypothetical protein